MIHHIFIQIPAISLSQHAFIYFSRVRALRTNKFDRTKAEQSINHDLFSIGSVFSDATNSNFDDDLILSDASTDDESSSFGIR